MQLNQDRLLIDVSENKFDANIKKFIDSTPIGMYVLNDGLISYCNKKFADILNYEVKDLVHKKGIKDLINPSDWDKIESGFLDLIKNDGDTWSQSFKLLRNNDEVLESVLFFTKVQVNGNLVIIGSLMDPSENKNDPEPLSILAHAIKSSGECVTITDLNHRIFYVNETLCRTFGYNKEELIGKNIDIFHKGLVDDEQFQYIIKKTHETGWKGELLSRRKDGSVLPIWLTTTLVKDKFNKPMALVGFSQDISDRKKIVEDLNKSETKIRTLLEKMPDGLVYLKLIFNEKMNAADFEIVQMNKAFRKIISFGGKDLKGTTVTSLLSRAPDLDRNLLERLIKICLNQKDEEFEVYSSRFDKHYSISAYSPEENYLVVIVKDITSSKKADEELIRSKHMLRTILDNIPQRVFWKDKNSVFKGCNIHFAKDLGFENPDVIIGKTDLDLDYENLAGEFVSSDRYVMDNDDPIIIESEKHFKPDGTPIWIRLNKVPLKDKDNKVVGVIGTYEDISKKKSIQEDIRKLSQAVEQNPVSIVITDLNGNIEYVNPKFTRLTGYTLEEVKGKNPRILKSGHMNQKAYEDMWRSIKSGKEWMGEFHNKKKNGELYWEYASISPIKDESGKITHYLAVKEDITAKKNFEVELKAAKEKAEEMNHLKSIFLANISHELRTPLIGIMGYAETLCSEIENPELKDMARTLLKSGMRLKETLNLILDLSHIEADKLEISLTPQNITQIILEKLNAYHFSAQEKGLSFQLIIKEENLNVKIDANMFVQVIDNLFNNAIKYTSKGEISIILDKREENDEHYARIIVKDSGIGIPNESIKLIFEPFRQVSEGLSRTYEGMGLGLTITKRFVEKMSGKISVQSDIGKGTEFIIEFPLTSSEEILGGSAIDASDSTYHSSNRKYKFNSEVLLIEDDEPTANIIKIYLNDICHTDWVSSGEAAVKKVLDRDYSVIMVDINLGFGMDGLATIKEIKKINGYKDTPIIAVTAYAMYGDKETFLNEGFTHYISKPFNKKEINNLIEEILQKRT